jgi:hypothetical protein
MDTLISFSLTAGGDDEAKSKIKIGQINECSCQRAVKVDVHTWLLWFTYNDCTMLMAAV